MNDEAARWREHEEAQLLGNLELSYAQRIACLEQLRKFAQEVKHIQRPNRHTEGAS